MSELCVSYGDSVLMKTKVRSNFLRAYIFYITMNMANNDTVHVLLQCCYFIRSGNQVDVSIDNDSSLLYGELSSSPLETIEALLSSKYVPLVSSSCEWGKASDEQKDDYNAEMVRFDHNLKSVMESMFGGVLLRLPSNELIEQCSHSMNTQILSNPVPENLELIIQLENIVGEWCDQIETYLSSGDSVTNETTVSSKSMPVSNDVGPKGELEYWRIRIQSLISIIEQLKQRKCNIVIEILSTFTKRCGDQEKAKIMLLISRWKQIDINVTEAANEAKDNVKYLFSLHRFIGPLYTGSIQSIIDTLPALINSIKVS